MKLLKFRGIEKLEWRLDGDTSRELKRIGASFSPPFGEERTSLNRSPNTVLTQHNIHTKQLYHEAADTQALAK